MTTFITEQHDLNEFAARACAGSVLAIDTEFLREKTYYANLCLLQMNLDGEVVIVDPFAVRDLTVLAPAFEAEGLTKVLHAGGQDVEILLREVGVTPRPVFDTQLAAALLGHSQQVGYATLVAGLCGVQLRKTDSFTDWSRRPLSGSQVRYAAEDVAYLPAMHRKMRAQLESKGRLGWLDADFARLSDPETYRIDPRERYQHLKRFAQMSRRQLSAARELAAWRELRAQKTDMPRKWVLTDEQVVEACKREARTIDQLFMVRGVREHLGTREAREAVASIVRGLDLPADEWPVIDRSPRNESNVDIVLDAMNAVVRLRSRESGIAFQTLASHADLCALARGNRDVELMRGWRKAIVGDELVELLEGRLSLSVRKGNLEITKHAPARKSCE